MKIALCISGQPIYVKESYETTIFKNFIQPNNITDIFVHTWWRPEWGEGATYANFNRPTYRFSKNTIQDIKFFYHPRKMEVEDDTTYHDFIKKEFIDNENFISAEKINILQWYPKYLSIYKANKLKNDYEKEHGFEYDIVVKMRFDWYFYFPVILKDLDLTKVHVNTPGSGEKGNLKPGDKGVGDQFAVGNKKSMDVYCNIAMDMHGVAKRHPETSSESTVGNYLYDAGIRAYYSWQDRIDMETYYYHDKSRLFWK